MAMQMGVIREALVERVEPDVAAAVKEAIDVRRTKQSALLGVDTWHVCHGTAILRLLVRFCTRYSVGCSLRGGAMVAEECPPSVQR